MEKKMGNQSGNLVAHRANEEKSLKMGIYNASIFSSLIRHERNRSDRTGKVFTLVAFDREQVFTVKMKSTCARIASVMRTIDEIGWLEDGRVGVLLPVTTLEGAHQFARRVSAEVSGLSYKVYLYPDHWMKAFEENKEANNERDELHASSIDSPSHHVRAWKRATDIVGATLGLLILWPLFLIVSIFLKLVSPGPVFFRQKRVGLEGELFTLIKFRTMKHGNNQGTHQEHIIRRIRAGESLAKLDAFDPRTIPGGKILRKLCIDELPQLINVLKGDMSLVGPRPCLPYEAREFLMWHTHRFDTLPGMTGLWQVSGKNKLTFAQMIRLDIAYASRISPWNDLVILVRTFPAIIAMVVESLTDKIHAEEKNDNDQHPVEELLMHRQAVL